MKSFRLALLGSALAATLSVATPAYAIFGLFEDDPDELVIANPFAYDATVITQAEDDLETTIRNASALFSDREDPASGPGGLLATARADYGRIVAALYTQGYYGGSVSIAINGREASAIAPLTELAEPADVTIRVDPGPQFYFGPLRIENRPPSPVAEDDEVQAPEELGFRTGNVARSGIIERAEQALLEGWRQLGYAKAAIATREVVADHPNNTLEVVLRVDPGRQAAVGPVSVSGERDMNPDFIVRQTGLTTGQEYDPDDIARARDRLARLDVFRALRIEAAESIPPSGLLPFDVIVQERALRRFGVGATVSNIDGLGLETFWLHRNLFGQAERLRLDASVAGIGYPVETEDFDYAFGGTFTKPGFLTPDTDLVTEVSARRTVLQRYTETSALARVGLTQMFSDEITFGGGFSVKASEFVDEAFGAREFLTVGGYANATFDNRDSELDPTEGFYLSGEVQPAYEFNFQNVIARSTLEGRAYLGLGEDDDVVLAGRLKAGALTGPTIGEIPPDLLFFAGGGGSVRGYGFRSIGVEGPDDTVIGGRYVLEGSAEARVRITESFGAVGFVDGGFVAADEFPTLDDLRLGVGAGVRYYTGLGPLRLDVAVPLNKIEDEDPGYAFYLGIGQSF